MEAHGNIVAHRIVVRNLLDSRENSIPNKQRENEVNEMEGRELKGTRNL